MERSESITLSLNVRLARCDWVQSLAASKSASVYTPTLAAVLSSLLPSRSYLAIRYIMAAVLFASSLVVGGCQGVRFSLICISCFS